jgi:hypothetical protein
MLQHVSSTSIKANEHGLAGYSVGLLIAFSTANLSTLPIVPQPTNPQKADNPTILLAGTNG